MEENNKRKRSQGFYFIRIDEEWTIAYYYPSVDNWCIPSEDSFGRYYENEFSEVGVRVRIPEFGVQQKKTYQPPESMAKFIDDIRKEFDISLIGFKSRQASVILVKTAIAGCLREKTDLSLQKIGDALDKDHATILNLAKKHDKLVKEDKDYCKIYNKVLSIFSDASI